MQTSAPGDKVDAARAALDQWERICLRRLERGQSAAYDFRSDALPRPVKDALQAALDADLATTTDAVRAVFALALLNLAHPAQTP